MIGIFAAIHRCRRATGKNKGASMEAKVCLLEFSGVSGCFPKRYSKIKKTKWTFEFRSHAFFFSFSSGPPTKCSSTARQRKVCARFAQGFDSSARQVPVTGEQMI